MDTTLEFERKRNVPVKYSRDLIRKTLSAMKQIQTIKERREKAFWEKRMRARVEVETASGVKTLQRGLNRITDVTKKEAARVQIEEAATRKQEAREQFRAQRMAEKGASTKDEDMAEEEEPAAAPKAAPKKIIKRKVKITA